jgi:hypothetical protein
VALEVWGSLPVKILRVDRNREEAGVACTIPTSRVAVAALARSSLRRRKKDCFILFYRGKLLLKPRANLSCAQWMMPSAAGLEVV